MNTFASQNLHIYGASTLFSSVPMHKTFCIAYLRIQSGRKRQLIELLVLTKCQKTKTIIMHAISISQYAFAKELKHQKKRIIALRCVTTIDIVEMRYTIAYRQNKETKKKQKKKMRGKAWKTVIHIQVAFNFHLMHFTILD